MMHNMKIHPNTLQCGSDLALIGVLETNNKTNKWQLLFRELSFVIIFFKTEET